MAMGFAREEVEVCLRAALNDGNVAVEFLMNGIPEGLGADDCDGHDGQAMTNLTPEQAQQIQAFLNSEEFQTLREQLRDDPSLLQTFMDQ